VESIARGYQDPHFVEAKPSFILKLQKADILVAVGRDLEIGWLPPLIQQSRNAKVQVGGSGYVDASLKARILEIPQGQITRAEGDVHPLGNPHYWLDPENGKLVAKEIADKLSQLRPGDRAFFEQRLTDFTARVAEAEKRWESTMAPYKGTKVVTYHRSFPNFAERFGLDVIGYVEPRPGIPPSPQHTLDLINDMKRQNVKLVLVEPVLRSEDPELDWSCHRRRGPRHAAISRRRQGSHRLFQAVRLRHQFAHWRAEESRRPDEVRTPWTLQ
jgi:ABC-type Zn uptake system ZnuABC Zn-binding protein ZnuA